MFGHVAGGEVVRFTPEQLCLLVYVTFLILLLSWQCHTSLREPYKRAECREGQMWVKEKGSRYWEREEPVIECEDRQ